MAFFSIFIVSLGEQLDKFVYLYEMQRGSRESDAFFRLSRLTARFSREAQIVFSPKPAIMSKWFVRGYLILRHQRPSVGPCQYGRTDILYFCSVCTALY